VLSTFLGFRDTLKTYFYSVPLVLAESGCDEDESAFLTSSATVSSSCCTASGWVAHNTAHKYERF